jgi:chromate transport protein ChrA
LEAISEMKDVITLVNEGLTFVASLAGILAVAMILYGGWLYVSSAGDSEKTKQAQGTITNAIIALIIIFALRMILILCNRVSLYECLVSRVFLKFSRIKVLNLQKE